MSAPRLASGRVVLLALVLALVLSTPTGGQAPGQQPGQQPVAKPADQAAINQAIESGVRYLRSVQTPSGSWGTGTGPGSDKGWAVGYTALAGIALIECGVPATDPGVKLAAEGVRHYADLGDLDSTYEVALAILLLDRMGGGKSDRVRIQRLAGRLIAGQTLTGGWGYKVPKISPNEQESLMNALRKMSAPPPPPEPSVRERPSSLGLCIKASEDVVVKPPLAFDPEKARTSALASLTPAMKQWSVFQNPNQVVLGDPKDKPSEPFRATTDNSNTHFAMLAIWAARKHDMPVERSLLLLAQRFRSSQGKDGTWGYYYAKNGGGGSPAMSCVALLGLAIGHVVDPDVAVRPEQDPRVVNAFAWLSGRVGAPVGTIFNRPSPKEAGGYYYFWAMERIAVLYDVGKLDKKDWYLWGAEILLGHQKPDGSWDDGGDLLKHPALCTSMALLFLKRANLTPDLSRRLTVDTSALTQKVSDTVSPQSPPMSPSPPPPPVTIAMEVAPMPHEASVSRPTPTPPVNSPMPTATAPTSEATPAAPAKKSSWLWIVLIAVLLAVLAACVFFFMRMKKANPEEEQPRKKKRKVKAKVED